MTLATHTGARTFSRVYILTLALTTLSVFGCNKGDSGAAMGASPPDAQPPGSGPGTRDGSAGPTPAVPGGDPENPGAPPGSPANEFRAFPEAAGFGAQALTECDRQSIRVVPVTSLADSGPGTLRDAITQAPSSPDEYRIITFRTGGTITLNDEIQIRQGCLYIAGQTAPGDGVQLRSPPDQGDRLLAIHPRAGLNDVVIRYLRLRAGRGDPGGAGDNVTISSGTRLILDHLSLSWANDEALGLTTLGGGEPLFEVTVQRTILAAVLERHSVGTLFGQGTADVPASDMSMHHNLFAHNRHRNPRITYGRRIEVIHNVTYNWAARVGRTFADAELDLIGNSWIPGPLSRTDSWFQHEGAGASSPNNPFPLPSVYWSDNQSDRGEIEWDTYIDVRQGDVVVPVSARRDNPHAPAAKLPVHVTSAQDGMESVLNDVGANARLDCEGQWVDALDRVDAQFIRDVREKTGRSTRAEGDHPDDYGGYPNLAAGTPCEDADGDGMFDAWEALHGLSASDPSDALQDADGDGYVNVEELINGTDPGP